MSDAYIVAPGGMGTAFGAMVVRRLLQVRLLQDAPLIFANPLWKGLVDWARAQMLRQGSNLANP